MDLVARLQAGQHHKDKVAMLPNMLCRTELSCTQLSYYPNLLVWMNMRP